MCLFVVIIMVNSFRIEKEDRKNAEAHCDQHVIKMPLEATQVVYSALFLCLGKDQEHYQRVIRGAPQTKTGSAGYRPTHTKHPLVLWTAQCDKNLLYMIQYGLCLCEEYHYRFHKRHASKPHLIWLRQQIHINENNIPFPIHDTASLPILARSGESLLTSCTLEQAREYYRKKAAEGFKRPMRYTSRYPPSWLLDKGTTTGLFIEQQYKPNGLEMYMVHKVVSS